MIHGVALMKVNLTKVVFSMFDLNQIKEKLE